MTLQDEAASVRQAAVDLLGSHIGARRDLALAYFETLVTASRDTSTSVSACGATLRKTSSQRSCTCLLQQLSVKPWILP